MKLKKIKILTTSAITALALAGCGSIDGNDEVATSLVGTLDTSFNTTGVRVDGNTEPNWQ